MVTPDGERTMNTFLGAAQDLKPADIDRDGHFGSAAVTYLEGYLWDPPQAKEAFVKAAAIAHKAGQQVALTLSDAFCVDRYRAEFLDLIKKRIVDIVFANEKRTAQPLSDGRFRHRGESAARARPSSPWSRAARMAASCSPSAGDVAVPAEPVDKVVDVTGAGDLFAAGFLVGLARGKDHRTAARLGGLCAAEVIQHIGARPAVSLKVLAEENGLLVEIRAGGVRRRGTFRGAPHARSVVKKRFANNFCIGRRLADVRIAVAPALAQRLVTDW